MKPHRMSRWAHIAAMLALVPAFAWAQDGPDGRRASVVPEEPADGAGSDLFSWSVMQVSGLTSASTLGTLWVNEDNDAYVWAVRPVFTVPMRTQAGPFILPEIPPFPPDGGSGAKFSLTSSLLRYDGTGWSPVVELENEVAATLFGTHPNEVYAATDAPDGTVRVYHLTGNHWCRERLPDGITGPAGDFAGDAGRTFFRAGDKILMRTGQRWRVVYENDQLVPGHALVFLDRDQVIAPGTNGQAVWDGETWTWTPMAWDMDVHGAWGARDAAGELHMFATGHEPAQRGMCSVQFVEDVPGCLHGTYVESLPEPTADPFSGLGIEAWGTGPHDVYMVGRFHDQGFIERFNGFRWNRIDPIPDMTVPTSVGGTPAGDVWVALRDGRIVRGVRREPLVQPIDADDDIVVMPASDLAVRRESSRSFVIEYGLTEGRQVVGGVFDVTGRRVAVLENAYRDAGTHQVRWDARDVRPGVYFYRLRAGPVVGAGRMVVDR